MYLVTGGNGFVGSRLCKFLERSNQSIRKIVREKKESDPHEQVVCNFIHDQILDGVCDGVSVIFHLAGLAHDMRSAASIENQYRAVNVEATIRLAELAADAGVKHFVFVSSVKAGGRPLPGETMSEINQGEPDGVYGRTKREAELAVLAIGKASGMKVSVIRPSLVYGPGVKGNLQMMLRGIRGGWFPPVPETGNSRCMIHVDELVEAIVMLAESSDTAGEIYIATDGQRYSTRQIYELLHQSIGRRSPKWHIPKFVFSALSWGETKLSEKLDKLFGDECYSSQKLESAGFKPTLTLRDINKYKF